MAIIERVFVGLRESMVAEVAAFDPTTNDMGVSARQAKYLVMPDGDAQYDTEWFASKSEAKAHARYIAAQNGGCPVCCI